MGKRLYECESEHEQTAWAVSHLKAGGAISDVSLWLAGIDRPMRLLAKTKSALREEGLVVTSSMKNVRDAAGETHDVLTWRVER
ncbi:hypothetical protein [Sphingomonas sp. 3-13AW]|uniref:hypothetical protein n=1 Tax=Sphingomonas sp. 3-13AW TaxID=3050450 RepID=UPI003BB53CFC